MGIGNRLRCLIVAGVLAMPAGLSVADAAPLSPWDRQLFREGHAESLAGSSGLGGRFRGALDRAAELGREGNIGAALFLLDLGDRTILLRFMQGFSAPATPELEIAVMKHLRNPAYGTCFSANLLRKYQLRALYDALLAEARARQEGSNYCVWAMVRTDLPGIEDGLAGILPHLDDYDSQVAVATALVARKYAAAEPALIDMLRRSNEKTAGSISWIVVKLDSPAMLNAITKRLADFRGAAPSPELESTLTSMIAAILHATPQAKMDRGLLPQKVIDAFPPAYREKIVIMLQDRDKVEALAHDMTPDNLAYWIGQHKNERVRAFIIAGVDVNALGKSSGDRPLHVAVKHGNFEAMELLLAAGADPNGKDWQGVTPLKELSGRKAHDDSLDANGLAAARLLIAKGADPSMPSADTWTPLHLATARNFAAMARLLVENGASVNAEAMEQGIQGLTPTQIAEDQVYRELAAFLRSKGGKVNLAFLAKRTAQRALVNAVAPFLRQH